MVTDSPGFMICGGAGTRLGSRRSGSFTHGRVGLGPAQPSTKFPSSSALLLGLILMFIPDWKAMFGGVTLPSVAVSSICCVVISLMTPANTVSDEEALASLEKEREVFSS